MEPSDAMSEALPASQSFRQCGELSWIFEELPKATIVSVSRPDTGDISPILLSYTIELKYKQFKWRLTKKGSQVLYLHFALKKRVLIEEFHDKQEQENTRIYHEVFSCIPSDDIYSRAAVRQKMAHMKEKFGHTTIDLGIGPDQTEHADRLKCIKGHLVYFPLKFMREEDLRPVFNESEFYVSPHVYH